MSNPFLRVSLQDKILFARHLSMSLKAGKSLLDSVSLIKEQTKSKSLKKILDGIITDVENGQFLSASLEKNKGVFGNLFINIVRVGEASGTLTENLIYIGDELKKKQDLRRKVRGALIYPAVILVATFGISGAMIVFVFPKILPVFASLSIDLPVTTRALIAISDLVSNHGLGVLIGIIAVVFLLVFLRRVKAVRYYFQYVSLNFPLIKSLMVNFNIANFTRTLGLLLKSGMRVVEAVEVTADSLGNIHYQRELKKAAKEVGKGEFISRSLAQTPRLFPIIVTNMIEVGENTGNLTENLFYLAEFYTDEVDAFVKNLSSVLEPILMVIMGVIVGFIALAIITPIYQITESLTL